MLANSVLLMGRPRPASMAQQNIRRTWRFQGKSLIQLAEGVGFEPTRAFAPPVFKTGAFNRSATLPRLKKRLRAGILCRGR